MMTQYLPAVMRLRTNLVINFMNIFQTLKFFKKQSEDKTPLRKEVKEAKFQIPHEDLQALYDSSVQKKPKDFIIKNFDVSGNPVSIAFDEADEIEDYGGAGGLAEAINDVYKMQEAGQEIIFTYFAKQGFIGFNNCAVLAQDWLIQKAISAPCTDAAAVKYKINCDDADLIENEKDFMSDMKKISDDKTKFDIKKICKIFAENKRKYGQSICIPIVEGADYSKPFNIDSVRPGSYKGMTVIEPVWLAPVLDIENTVNPLSRRFYQPSYFRLPNGVIVHYSWTVFNIYGTVSDILKPAYYWGGIPLPQLLYEQVYAAHKTAKEAPMLAQSKRLNYVEVNPNALLFNSTKRDEIKLMSWLRSNFGWLLIKRDQKIGQIDTTLTDFDAVTMLGYQIVAAISGVIATRLLETSPKGWQSTGSYEDKQYIKLQKTIQEEDFIPILDFHYRLLVKSKYNLDRRYIITFDEIDSPSAKEAAEIREINARTASAYIQAGVIAPDEERALLRQDENSGYTALEEDMPEAEPDIFEKENINSEAKTADNIEPVQC